MEFIALLLLLGLATGLLAGLLGIGGGVITVPALYYILTQYGFPQEKIMQIAIATALGSTVLTSIGSTWAHFQKEGIHLPALKKISFGLVAGCFAGGYLSHLLPSEVLRIIFGVMALLFALYLFFPHLPQPRFAPKPNGILSIFGLLIGCISTLLGVGGGVFMVPILLGFALSMRNAVGTSSAGTLATAFLGTAIYLVLGWREIPLPHFAGYLYIPAFLTIGPASLLTTRIGVKWAHALPVPLLKRIFAAALTGTGLAMLLGK